MKETIGQRIERLRKQKGWTQKALAEMIGMSQQAFAALEKKETAPKKIFEISQALGVSTYYLHTGEHQENSLSAVPAQQQNNYSCEEVSSTVPVALDRTIAAISKQLAAQGKGPLDIYKHKDLIAKFLSASIAVELTGDYEIITKAFDELKLEGF